MTPLPDLDPARLFTHADTASASEPRRNASGPVRTAEALADALAAEAREEQGRDPGFPSGWWIWPALALGLLILGLIVGTVFYQLAAFLWGCMEWARDVSVEWRGR